MASLSCVAATVSASTCLSRTGSRSVSPRARIRIPRFINRLVSVTRYRWNSCIRKFTSLEGRCQFSAENANKVRYGIPSSRAASTTARTESLPRRWPSLRPNPRRRANLPLPSITIATCRVRREGSSESSGKSLSGRVMATWLKSAARELAANAGRSDLHNLGFLARQNLVDPLGKLGRELLNPGFRAAHLVVGSLLFLVQIFHHVVRVAAVIADADPEFLRDLPHVPHQLLAALLGQLRNRDADQLSIAHRVEAQIRGLDGFFDIMERRLVVRSNDEQPHLGRG